MKVYKDSISVNCLPEVRSWVHSLPRGHARIKMIWLQKKGKKRANKMLLRLPTPFNHVLYVMNRLLVSRSLFFSEAVSASLSAVRSAILGAAWFWRLCRRLVLACLIGSTTTAEEGTGSGSGWIARNWLSTSGFVSITSIPQYSTVILSSQSHRTRFCT